MKIHIVLRVLGLLSVIISLTMVFPLIWSIIDGTPDTIAFLMSMTLGIGIGTILYLLGDRSREYAELNVREAFAVVSLSWVMASIVGALPYYMGEYLPTFADAFFEAMSGFSTTGATVFTDIEANPRGILFWRSLTHWIGGMGIIVLSLAILPFIGVGGMQLFRAEVPGPTPEKLSPRIQQTALMLWAVYVVISAAQTVVLMLCGLDLFDSLTHTFGTMATGGFSPYNDSIAAFRSPLIEWVIILFMFLAGTNFVLHLLALRGKPGSFWKDEEFRFYVKFTLLSIAAVTAFLLIKGHYGSFSDTFRNSAFQVISIMTTTGYVTSDFNLWPQALRLLMLLLMFAGGCAGSTGGSMKQVRLMILAKRVKVEINRLLHPQQVLRVRFNKQVLSLDVISSVTAFYILYMMFFVGFSLIIITITGLDLETGIASVAATLGNIGPGLGGVGAVENYSFFNMPAKLILSFCMLLGRLELFSVVMLFVKGTWRS